MRKIQEEGEAVKDIHGRNIDYMRISITDRCNLRCKYCMPEGIDCVKRWEILSLEEIREIVACGASLGIRHIKITGGEPLVRKDCCHLVELLKSVSGIETVTITTNGVLLEPYLKPLLKAGIDGINISLDTLERNLYQEITGQDQLDQVLKAIRQAVDYGILVKVNAVAAKFREEKGSEAGNWRGLVELARRLPVHVRFIEMMPVGYGKSFQSTDPKMLLEEIRREYPGLKKDERMHGFGPAVYYRIPGFLGSIGVIRAMHGKFCGECNRVRLTSQGFLKGCLCYEDGVDLRALLRDGAEMPEQDKHYQWIKRENEAEIQRRLKEAMRRVIWEKPAAHCFERPERMTERRGMSAIGG
ncbi:MAG: GTP 3',8-cyclase MoaA [Lachnospiraceae bacterium]|nr:GTP 3',8-cyclase MoaA [Lachnospiraceae bacterium]